MKREKIIRHMKNKTYKSKMVGYSDNHTRDTNKLYNPDTKRVVMIKDIKC